MPEAAIRNGNITAAHMRQSDLRLKPFARGRSHEAIRTRPFARGLSCEAIRTKQLLGYCSQWNVEAPWNEPGPDRSYISWLRFHSLAQSPSLDTIVRSTPRIVLISKSNSVT